MASSVICREFSGGASGSSADSYWSQLQAFKYKHRHEPFLLNKPADCLLMIAHLKDTVYADDPEEVNGWGKFYLPEQVTMAVFGEVSGPSLCDPLVLMMCGDGRIFAFDGEELHVAANSLEELEEKRELEYPSDESYYNGQAFEKMTSADWDEVRKGEVGRQLDKKHAELVQKNKASFLENLNRLK